jgi:hypothetical protein
MRWDRISVLIEKMQEDLVQQGYERAIFKNLCTDMLADTSTSTQHRIRPYIYRQA